MSVTKQAKYKLTDEMKKYFTSVLLLENLVNFGHEYPVLLKGDSVHLEPMLVYMVSKGYIEIRNNRYEPTKKGGEVLKNHLEKLEEFRRVYRIYSAVDTGEGTFAFEEYFNVETDEEFDKILNDERYVDLRIALCELKGINPLEIVFLEFIDNGEFNVHHLGWELDLMTGSIWFDILDIVNNNIYLEDLAEEETSGEEVMKLIVEAGSKVMTELLAEQDRLDAEEEEDEEEYEDEEEEEEFITTYEVEYIEEPYFDLSYYDAYYDPYYYSPIWGVYYY